MIHDHHVKYHLMENIQNIYNICARNKRYTTAKNMIFIEGGDLIFTICKMTMVMMWDWSE